MSTIKTTNIQHPSAASPAIELTAAGGLWLGGGKVLQVVRATDTTQRSTTSTSHVDVTGMSVTITPQKSDSAIMLVASVRITQTNSSDTNIFGGLVITDASNNVISGAENAGFGTQGLTYSGSGNVGDVVAIIAYATPATTSPTTYKLRMKSNSANNTFRIDNNANTGQMYAIEVSA